jgi:hypothetical protein
VLNNRFSAKEKAFPDHTGEARFANIHVSELSGSETRQENEGQGVPGTGCAEGA